MGNQNNHQNGNASETDNKNQAASKHNKQNTPHIDGRTFVKKAADYKGWVLCKDQELLADIISGLEANFSRYGYFQCPCRDSWGQKEKDRDIICPCDYAAPDIEEYGHCFCGLFYDPSIGPKLPQSIPERRPDSLYP